MVWVLLAGLLWQPNPEALRRLFEQAHERGKTAQTARDLGLFLRSEGQLEAARVALGEALAKDEQSLIIAAELASVSPPAEAATLWARVSKGPDHLLAAQAWGALGALAQAEGNTATAVTAYRNALARQEASGDLLQVAVRINALAPLLPPGQGRPLLERALTINRSKLGAQHPETATTAANLAGVLLNQGLADRAIALLNESIQTFVLTLPPDHPRVASASTVLAYAYKAKRNLPKAEELLRQALAINEQAYGTRHPETATSIQTLAEFLQETGKIFEARLLLGRLR